MVRAISTIRSNLARIFGSLCSCLYNPVYKTTPVSRVPSNASRTGIQTLQQNYDVFINHRGPDVKTGFVAHLHDELCKSGLHPFLDANSIDQGDHVLASIHDALRNASIYVAIFSKHYAESAYCLNELYEMLQNNKVILPVFYDVEPKDVRWPHQGPFGHGFRKFYRRGRHEDIKRWEKALQDVAELRGFRQAGDESELKKSIVSRIQSELQRTRLMQSTDIATGLAGVSF